MTKACATPGMERSARLDLRRVHGRALHLEHVVAPAREPEVAVRVEAPEIAGRVVAVGVEELGARPTADAAHHVRSAQLDLALDAGRDRPAALGVDDADLDACERAAAAAVLARREIDVEARAAVRAAGLRHAEEVRARPGPRTLLPAAGPLRGSPGRSDERSAAAKSGCAAMRAA